MTSLISCRNVLERKKTRGAVYLAQSYFNLFLTCCSSFFLWGISQDWNHTNLQFKQLKLPVNMQHSLSFFKFLFSFVFHLRKLCSHCPLASFSFSVVNCMCPWCGCSALSNVLAAHLHPCAAPASSGLLLVRLTTSEIHTCTHMHTHARTHTIRTVTINVYTPSFSLLPLSLLLSLISQRPSDKCALTHTWHRYINAHHAMCAGHASSSAAKTSV